MCTSSYQHHQIECMTHLPLFRVRSWNNDMSGVSSYIPMDKLLCNNDKCRIVWHWKDRLRLTFTITLSEYVEYIQIYPIDCENMCTSSDHNHEIGSMTHLPLFGVRSWHNGMSGVSCYILTDMLLCNNDLYRIVWHWKDRLRWNFTNTGIFTIFHWIYFLFVAFCVLVYCFKIAPNFGYYLSTFMMLLISDHGCHGRAWHGESYNKPLT